MEIPTDRLKQLYEAATIRKKALFRFYIGYMVLALFAITSISIFFEFDHKAWIIGFAFLIYALCSTLVAVMAFFNDSYYDISESLKKEQNEPDRL